MNAQAQEALRTIREAAKALPSGKCNQVINRCNRIELILKRTPEADTRTPAQQVDQIVEQYNTAQRIVAALLSGRVLSQRDSKEFKTTAFHSRICDARRILARRYPEYILRSRYTDNMETIAGRPFKIYWLETL